MRLVHELEQLVDDGLQKLPMSAQETWVLAHHVHDVRRNNRLVILAAFLFAQAKKILNEMVMIGSILMLSVP